MKATGLVRRLDDLGRMVIPKEMRDTLDIKPGDPMEIMLDKQQLIFRKYQAAENAEEELRRFIRWVAANVPPEKWSDLWPAAKELEAMVSNDSE